MSAPAEPPTLVLHPDRMVRVLAAGAVAIIVLGAACRALGVPAPAGGDGEVALGTLRGFLTGGGAARWYGGGLLLFASILLAWIALDSRDRAGRFTAHWSVLAALVLGLAFDRIARVGGDVGRAVDSAIGSALSVDVPAWLWGAAIVLALWAAYGRFFRHLPWRLQVALGLGAALYAGGAVGADAVQGLLSVARGDRTAAAVAVFAAREAAELSGVLLFLVGVLGHAADDAPRFSVQLASGSGDGEEGREVRPPDASSSPGAPSGS